MKYFLTIAWAFLVFELSAQTCTSNPTTLGSINFSQITWTASGGASCPTGASTYNATLNVNIENNAVLTMDQNVTINGDFPISNNGQEAVFFIPAGVTVTINGDLGDDANNNFVFRIEGTLNVTGTLYGKNSNAFEGGGSVSAGGLDFSQPPTCNPCTIKFDVDTCTPANSTFCGYAMPIELLSFEAMSEETKVSLLWSTASEENFDYFTVERSPDAVNYEIIGTVPGNGWSDKIIEYSFSDNTPLLGRAYYRLKATDFDGTFEYFKPIMVNNNDGSRAIRLSSNPVGDQPLKFQLNFQPKEEIHFTVTDLSGVEVISGTLTPGLSHYTIEKQLEKGMYLLRVSSGNDSFTSRFLKR